MAPHSRKLAAALLIVLPTVESGGAALLWMLTSGEPGFLDNPLRQGMFRAGHAHAGVLLVLSLVALRYVDEARLPGPWAWVARLGIPVAALLMPAGFFLSVVPPSATEPNGLIALIWVGAASLAVGLVTLGIGLLRAR